MPTDNNFQNVRNFTSTVKNRKQRFYVGIKSFGKKQEAGGTAELLVFKLIQLPKRSQTFQFHLYDKIRKF